MDFKKLLTRGLSGIIYVAIIVGCILWGYPGISILGIVLGILATIEFAKICGDMDRRNIPLVYLDTLGVVCLALSFNPVMPVFPIVLWGCIIIIRFILELYVNNENPLKSLAHSMFSQIYIGVPLACMGATAFIMVPKIILIVFLMLWINDTGAYIVGSMFGRHKLFERISPKKSWEGFFGGLVFNLVAATLFCYCTDSFMGLHSNIFQWIGLAVIVTVFGTWGDLIESMIKRHFHIKDSGNIIPGHGGILDRIDSFLLAMPSVTIYFAFLYLFA